jgi:hypothetical protein
MKGRVLPKITIISPAETTPTLSPNINKNRIEESFCSSSCNSSFASSFDSDIKNIQELTEVLEKGVKQGLNHYKKASQEIAQEINSLKGKVQNCERELDTVKINVVQLVNETSETTFYVKNLRENEFKTVMEANLSQKFSFDAKIPEVINQLRQDIEIMKRKIDIKEAEHLKSTEELKANYEFERKYFYDEPKQQICNCIIV